MPYCQIVHLGHQSVLVLSKMDLFLLLLLLHLFILLRRQTLLRFNVQYFVREEELTLEVHVNVSLDSKAKSVN